MICNNALLQQEDFPVGFAEQPIQMNDDPVFYVEWLDNDSEFPGLSKSKDLGDGNWELLGRKEIADEHTLIPVDDTWTKLNTAGKNDLYSNVAIKNAELQPTKRTIKPLWTDTKNKVKKTNNNETEDTDQDNLAFELDDIHKSQSRRANRYANRRLLHDRKTVDIHVEGVLRLATNRQGKTEVIWVPNEKDESGIDPLKKQSLANYVDMLANTGDSKKPQVLISKYNSKSMDYKRPIFPDNSEFSVHSSIVSK